MKSLHLQLKRYWIVTLVGFILAKIGQGVRIKPGVKVKFPWRLTVFDYVWIGENAWIDNSRASNHRKQCLYISRRLSVYRQP